MSCINGISINSDNQMINTHTHKLCYHYCWKHHNVQWYYWLLDGGLLPSEEDLIFDSAVSGLGLFIRGGFKDGSLGIIFRDLLRAFCLSWATIRGLMVVSEDCCCIEAVGVLIADVAIVGYNLGVYYSYEVNNYDDQSFLYKYIKHCLTEILPTH